MSGIEDGPVGWSTPERLDAREVFFIRHAENIHRWAAIEKDVQASALRFLTSLAEEIEQRALIPGINDADARLDVRKGDEWAGVGLSRGHWQGSGVSVRLEWWTKRVGFDVGSAAYVGVRLHEKSYEDQHMRQQFKNGLAPYQTETRSSATPRWPTWRRVPVDADLVTTDGVDLAGYRARLLEALVHEWNCVAGIVDRVLTDLASEGQVPT
jgi:hypothetical protein